MKLSDFYVGNLKAGQHDLKNLRGSRFARVEHDGGTWFYDLPAETSLDDFRIAAEVAWDRDAEYAEIWGSEGYARVSFD